MEYIYKPYSSYNDFIGDLDKIFNKPYKPHYVSYIGKYIIEADDYEDYMKGCLKAIELLQKDYRKYK